MMEDINLKVLWYDIYLYADVVWNDVNEFLDPHFNPYCFIDSWFELHGLIWYQRKASWIFKGIVWRLESGMNRTESLQKSEESCNTYDS